MSWIRSYYGYYIYVRLYTAQDGYAYEYTGKSGESCRSLLRFRTKKIAELQAKISIEKTLLWREVSALEKTMS